MKLRQLVGSLACRLVGSLARWLVGSLARWLVGLSAYQLDGRLIGFSAARQLVSSSFLARILLLATS